MFLNIPKYSCKMLAKCSNYARTLNMPGYVTCSTDFGGCPGFYFVRVLNMARFSMQGLRRVLNMSENGSIITEYASICLNVPIYSWMAWHFWIPENAWKFLNKLFRQCLIILDKWQGLAHASDIKYARVLNMQGYGYNVIFINATNVTILEFLSAQFVYLVALQLTIFCNAS